ncbi:MAG: signal peptide peptidase SppA [Planctomycetaceae bacterium]
MLLIASVVLNLTQLTQYKDYQAGNQAPYERFVDGELAAKDKIAELRIEGVIMPPYSSHILQTIERISEDDSVKGVLITIDSPGGLVADSHRIYDKLVKLREKVPMVVSFGRIAASGGYYAAMGAGPDSPIYAEETSWTGSIGVIIPRYDLSKLAASFGVQSDSIKTGPLKDSLDPFQPLTDQERRVWDTILEESLNRFVGVIDKGRKELDDAGVRQLATGQVFTSEQALQLKLIDKIGDRDAALADLQQQLGLEQVRVVRYEYPANLVDSLLGSRAEQLEAPRDPLSRLLDANVPRAMYLFGRHTP